MLTLNLTIARPYQSKEWKSMAANCIYELFGTESYHTAELKEP